MKVHLIRITLAVGLVAALLIGCQPIQPITPDAASAEEAEAEFVDAVMAVEAAYQSEDAEHAASFYTEDALSMPPGYPPSQGRAAIQNDLQFFYDSFDLERDFQLVNYQVDGNTATRTATWTQTLTPTDGSDPIIETGRCVLGFEKVDGEWKVAWEIWNTYEQ